MLDLLKTQQEMHIFVYRSNGSVVNTMDIEHEWCWGGIAALFRGVSLPKGLGASPRPIVSTSAEPVSQWASLYMARPLHSGT